MDKDLPIGPFTRIVTAYPVFAGAFLTLSLSVPIAPSTLVRKEATAGRWRQVGEVRGGENRNRIFEQACGETTCNPVYTVDQVVETLRTVLGRHNWPFSDGCLGSVEWVV